MAKALAKNCSCSHELCNFYNGRGRERGNYKHEVACYVNYVFYVGASEYLTGCVALHVAEDMGHGQHRQNISAFLSGIISPLRG